MRISWLSSTGVHHWICPLPKQLVLRCGSVHNGRIPIYVSPHKMGWHIVFSSVVCLSVRLSVHHAFVSALYLLNPWWDLQITLHQCQVWWDNVQCLCLTKVGSRLRSQSKIKHCMTVFRVRSISFEPLVGFKNNFAQMSSMMRRCAVPMFDQGRFKIKVTI